MSSKRITTNKLQHLWEISLSHYCAYVPRNCIGGSSFTESMAIFMPFTLLQKWVMKMSQMCFNVKITLWAFCVETLLICIREISRLREISWNNVIWNPRAIIKIFWIAKYDISYQLGRAVMGLEKFICLRKVRYSPAKRTKNYLESGSHVLKHKLVQKQLCDTSASEFRLKFLA